MNEQWYWRLAQDKQQALLKEAEQARRLKEAGIRDSVPDGLKVLALLSLPFVLVIMRAWLRA